MPIKELEDIDELPYHGPVEMENGIYYIGQFKNKLRHGKGKQAWIDGSLYEGYWFNDSANFKGIKCLYTGVLKLVVYWYIGVLQCMICYIKQGD